MANELESLPWKILDYEEVVMPASPVDEFAATALLLLPIARREDGKFIALQSTKTTLKLFAQANVPAAVPVPADDLLYKDQRSIDWFGPTIFVSAALLSDSPNIVSVALNLISSYLYDLFGRNSSTATVHLSVVVEETRTTNKKEIRYSGPVDGLKGVAQVVKNASRGHDD